MTLKDQLITDLPEGHEFVRVYAIDQYRTIVETLVNGTGQEGLLSKISIDEFFSAVPFMVVETQVTYNEVYDFLSRKFNLGLVQGVDYFNNETIIVGDERTYVSLPILADSYGYYGNLGCYLVQSGNTLATQMVSRDLTAYPQTLLNQDVKLRTTLCSTIFRLNGKLFLENRLTSGFVKLIWDTVTVNFPDGQDYLTQRDLVQGVVTNMFNDGLSDIIALKLYNGEVVLIRFASIPGDLPLKETEVGNILDETSQEDLSGIDGKDLEEAGEERGETITGKEEEELTNVNDDDILIPSLVLP